MNLWRLLVGIPLVLLLTTSKAEDVLIEKQGTQIQISKDLVEAIIKENILQTQINALLNQRQIELNDRMNQLIAAGFICT